MEDFCVSITPRFYETDAMGHINNAALAAWFEVGRVRFIEHLAAGIGMDLQAWILAATQIDYTAETLYGDDVEIRIVDATIGNSSVTVLCEMWQSGRMTLKGSAVVVHIDSATRKSKRVPDAFRDRLKSMQ